MRELEIETQVAQIMGRAHTKAPDPSLLEPCPPGEGEDKTYLLFTTGSLTYSPHQIGESPLSRGHRRRRRVTRLLFHAVLLDPHLKVSSGSSRTR